MRSLVIAVLALFLAPSPAPARVHWLWPVEGPVTGVFHLTADRFAAGQRRGIDIAAPPGTAVLAACGGRVTFAGRVPGAGRTVAVACGTLSATYLHLGSVSARRGEHKVAGGSIGTVGPGGLLRLGARVRVRRFGYVDPATLLGGAQPVERPPVLVPRRGPPPSTRPAPPEVAPEPVTVPRALPVAAPVRARAFWVPGPLAGLGLRVGFALLIAGFVVEAVRRGRAGSARGRAGGTVARSRLRPFWRLAGRR